MADEWVQVNVNLTADDVRLVDQMMNEDMFENRSAFVRKLIRQAWRNRRAGQPELLNTVEAVERAIQKGM